MNEKQSFFKLLKYSNELRRNNRYLGKEDTEKFKVFLNFLVRIERNLHYAEKQEYMELANNFLSDQVTAEDFCYGFMGIHGGINQKLKQMERDESVELGNFLNPSRPELGELLCRTYGSCDAFSLDPELTMSSETELKTDAQALLLKLKE